MRPMINLLDRHFVIGRPEFYNLINYCFQFNGLLYSDVNYFRPVCGNYDHPGIYCREIQGNPGSLCQLAGLWAWKEYQNCVWHVGGADRLLRAWSALRVRLRSCRYSAFFSSHLNFIFNQSELPFAIDIFKHFFFLFSTFKVVFIISNG